MKNKIFTFLLFTFLFSLPLITRADYVFDSTFASTSREAGFNRPEGLAVGNSGNIYVADMYNHRVVKISSSGNYITSWGSSGSGDGNFSYPYDLAVDDSENVYVADTNNHRIQKFSSSGEFITKWGTQGTEDGQIQYPQDVEVDASGNVYVADAGNYRIQKFSPTGDFILKWGTQGAEDAQFNGSLMSVAVDKSGNVYTTTDTESIQKFSPTGEFITRWGGYGTEDSKFNDPGDIDIDSSNNVYIADTYNHRIQEFSSTTVFITKWGAQGSGDGQLNAPFALAFDSSDNMFVTDSNNNRIVKYTYIAPDTTAPTVSTVTWIDADSSTDINGGDSLVITFSENMATTTATSTNVNTVLGLSNSHSFGTSPVAVWTGATVLTVTLDTDATVESGDTINPTSAVTDTAGNADVSTALSITDSIGPDAPVASLAAGTYTTFKNITTLTSEYSTDIHFTNDGTTPNCYSTLYTNPINVNHSFTLKAVGCDAYKNESSVLTVVYVVDVPVSGGGGVGGHGRNPRAAKPATPAVPNVSSAVPAVPNSQNISNSSAVPSQTVNSRNFTKDLSVGSSGDEVVLLQTFLEDGGYLIMPLGVSKGYYGTLTKNAVIKFQRVSGLPTPGKVGPMTRSILNLGN